MSPAKIKLRAQPIARPQRLSDDVVTAIRRDIESGRAAPGNRLPSEMELTGTFQVSRTVIREAVSRLQADGLVVSRQGSGIFVTSALKTPRSFRLGTQDSRKLSAAREIFELRVGVESEAAALAAQRRNRTDITALERALNKLTAAKNGAEIGVLADVEFHRRIAEISKNSQIASFLDFLASVLTETIRLARENSARKSGLTDQAHEEHVAIFKAITDGDAEAAREAARRHLINAQVRLGIG